MGKLIVEKDVYNALAKPQGAVSRAYLDKALSAKLPDQISKVSTHLKNLWDAGKIERSYVEASRTVFFWLPGKDCGDLVPDPHSNDDNRPEPATDVTEEIEDVKSDESSESPLESTQAATEQTNTQDTIGDYEQPTNARDFVLWYLRRSHPEGVPKPQLLKQLEDKAFDTKNFPYLVQRLRDFIHFDRTTKAYYLKPTAVNNTSFRNLLHNHVQSNVGSKVAGGDLPFAHVALSVEQNVTARMVSGKMERVVTNHYKLKVGDVEYGVLKKDIQDLVALYQANLPPN
jgi:hypothetical protein